MIKALRKLGGLLPRLLADRRGSSDLNTYLLLTAAGCTMVGLTAPHLFNSSKTASNTFEKQVEVLQQGASPGGGAASSSSGAGGWNIGDLGGLGNLAGQLGFGSNNGGLVSQGQLTSGQGVTVTAGGGTISGAGTAAAAGTAAPAATAKGK